MGFYNVSYLYLIPQCTMVWPFQLESIHFSLPIKICSPLPKHFQYINNRLFLFVSTWYKNILRQKWLANKLFLYFLWIKFDISYERNCQLNFFFLQFSKLKFIFWFCCYQVLSEVHHLNIVSFLVVGEDFVFDKLHLIYTCDSYLYLWLYDEKFFVMWYSWYQTSLATVILLISNLNSYCDTPDINPHSLTCNTW